MDSPKIETLKKIELINNTLQDFANARIPWSQRKEVAAWSALLFYIAIILSIFKFLGIDKTDPPKLQISVFFALFILTLLTFIFFRFIHANYASTYFFIAQIEVIKNIRLELIDKADKFFEENGIENSNDFNILIDKRIDVELKFNTQKFSGKLHPVLILLFFWFSFWIIKPFRWLYKKMSHAPETHSSPRKLGSIERMEAALYSLLILVFLISVCFLYKIDSIAK